MRRAAGPLPGQWLIDATGDSFAFGFDNDDFIALPGSTYPDGVLLTIDLADLRAESDSMMRIQFDVDRNPLDLNGDKIVDPADHRTYIHEFSFASAGDANLDGIFNSTDFILVMQAGKYQDELPLKSTWSDGDWNGDGDFDSSDFVVAFQAGTYEQPRRWTLPAIAAAIDALFDRAPPNAQKHEGPSACSNRSPEPLRGNERIVLRRCRLLIRTDSRLANSRHAPRITNIPDS